MPHSDVAATTATMAAQLPRPAAHLNGRAMDSDARAVPRSFKRHKALPHPEGFHLASAEMLGHPVDGSESARQSSSSSFTHDAASDRLSGGELPPTPPGYSRTSSSGSSALPSSPTYVASPAQSNTSVVVRSSGTPPNQKSPPTPDVTPPARERRPKAVRPSLIDRFPSKATTDSRAGSRLACLRSAPENDTPRRISLFRALSLSRNIRRDTAENPELAKGRRSSRSQYPTAEDPPEDDTRLHPFWRPASQEGSDDDSGSEEWSHDFPDDVDQVYIYPAVYSRPPPRRRDSLTARLKNTFAILPIDDDRHYTSDEPRDTDRRTIKRTPSGNLRVMRYPDNHQHESPPESRGLSRRWSLSSKSRDRPSTAPDRPEPKAWGPEKQVDDRGRRVFPGWQDKLEQMRPGNLQRRLSEHRRQKRTDALRQKISGPREVRDGVGEMIKRGSYRAAPGQWSQEQSPPETNEAYNYPRRDEVWDGRRI
ncbi:uncharacterized protein B0I36DRAFT_414396 [Microdochium trichocladiopsis]|uniref:Uncharacterized protein n=1 Tax=Microdochium trichocladiopsis TaxID=1682393 RepID=A0A9P9BJY3_9PEZI|nr:uncharacterized protein B0I36DRAFT_414396 [Microdochium trichocladiopsis]KAH7026064.1 hypothetical protein B0I36DRAFT_414396 [Microdochium trichocladiopsis]